MTLQRRHGIPATIRGTKIETDSRGNEHKVIDPDTSYEVKVWVFPQRSAKAEVPGQQHINVVRIGTNADLAGVDLWSTVRFRDKEWDVVTPPSYHHGTRHTRHWSIDLRERP